MPGQKTVAAATYIMFVSHCELNVEGLPCWHVELEDKELVDYVETLLDSNSFRTRCARVMKVGSHLLGIRRQLNTLVAQAEDVAFDLHVILFRHFRSALAYREGLVRLGT